jgi:hypothetical protein
MLRQFLAGGRMPHLEGEPKDRRGGHPAPFVATIIPRGLLPPPPRVGERFVDAAHADRLFKAMPFQAEHRRRVLDGLGFRKRVLQRLLRRRPSVALAGEAVARETLPHPLTRDLQFSRDRDLCVALAEHLHQLDVVRVDFIRAH